MASQLHQAVELAQAGQREQARQLFWQFLQTEPTNEVAWLWLASVAADQPEYQHALNQVLRINPSNQRAQQLLAEFQQQLTPPPMAATPPPPQVTPPLQYGAPASPPRGMPVYDYTSRAPEPVQGVPVQQQAPYSPVYAPPPQRAVEVQVREKRRGCLGCLPSAVGCGGCLGCGGCGQGCIIALVLFIVLPVLACGVLSFANVSLGPLNIPARYLPGELGRKSVTVDTGSYEVTLKVPRSWYYASADNDEWSMWIDVLDSAMPFEGDTGSWEDLASTPGQSYVFLDVDPIMLTQGGDMIGMVLYASPLTGSFDCDAVRAEYEVVTTYADGLCGYRNDEVAPASTIPTFKGIDPPESTHTIDFVVPITSTTASRWQISMPESVYDQINDQIDFMIESVEIKQN